MSKVRSYSDTGEVLRFHIDHLASDGASVHATETYGPYATRKAARIQAARYLRRANVGGHKAVARIEAAPTDWKEIPL